MYIQPMSEDTGGIQLPSDYGGTAFGASAPPPQAQEEVPESIAPEKPEACAEQADDTPAFAPARQKAASAPKSRGGIFSFLSGSPLLSSLLPPPRKGHEDENDIMQWILVGLVVLMLLNDSDDDILPLLLLLLLWK